VDRILITNDDGIEAPGLTVLEQIAGELAREVWIVAPEHDESGVSHAVSLHHPIRVSERGPRCYASGSLPVGKPARVARARENWIRTKTLKFLDSRVGKQVITGGRARIATISGIIGGSSRNETGDMGSPFVPTKSYRPVTRPDTN
jgi:Survival protein SurE